MKEFYTIGEISKIFNIPEPTLRYYDDIDLLCPWMIGENGYRYYSKAQFEVISTIVLLKDCGTPLKKLKEVLNEETAEPIRRELAAYSVQLEKQISELKTLKARVAKLDKNIEDTCFDEEIRISTLPVFYLLTNSFGEKDELDIGEIYAANNSLAKWVRSASIISTITKENLLNKNFHSYEDYGYLSEEPLSTDNPHFKKLSKREYLTCNMKVSSIEHSEVDRMYLKMLDYIDKNNYHITGAAIERNVLDLYNNDPQNPTMFFKVYIPITKKDR